MTNTNENKFYNKHLTSFINEVDKCIQTCDNTDLYKIIEPVLNATEKTMNVLESWETFQTWVKNDRRRFKKYVDAKVKFVECYLTYKF